MIVAIIMGIGLLIGIAALSLLSGALNFLFVKPKIEILKSKHGSTGFAFSFRWDHDAEPVSFDQLKVKLSNPFGTPAQIEIIREFDAAYADFFRDIELGLPMSNLLSATNMERALVEVEILATGDNISHIKTYKGKEFLDKLTQASLTIDDVAAKFVIEKVKPRFEIPEKTFISPPLPKSAKQLKMATNPMFAAQFAGMATAGVAIAESALNFTVTKVWIAPGCIVCDACEAIAPKVFEVTDTTCLIRPEALVAGALLDDGFRIQEAAEACPVEVIKYTKAA
jgi:ferredoxin